MSKGSLFYVEKPGLLTSIQDLGRRGHQEYGLSPGGVMDRFAAQVANILVGNARSEAVVEATLLGPSLRSLATCVIAICGADLSPKVDGKEVPCWKSFLWEKNTLLTFGAPRQGVRAYVAFAGGLDIAPFLGSKSTALNFQLGGLQGRALSKGTIIPGDPVLARERPIKRSLHPAWIPQYLPEVKARVILGPHTSAFTPDGLKAFVSSPYTITSKANRMGYRLSGATISHKDGREILSTAVTCGTIQVPRDGLPIVLMADHQTTGGYPCVATVISADLPALGQAGPGCRLHFAAISVEEAQAIFKQQLDLLAGLALAASS